MEFSAFAPLMAAFRQLRDAVVKVENREDIPSTVREAFSLVGEWAMANISGDIEQGAIYRLCNTVSQRVQPVADERIAGLGLLAS